MSNQSMKNFLTQRDTKEENWKIFEVWLIKNFLT